MAGIPDSFSTFLSTADEWGGGGSESAAPSSASSAPTHTGDVLKFISDGDEHSLDSIRESLKLGLRDIADTVSYLQSAGIVEVRDDTSVKPATEYVRLANVAS